MVIVHSYVKLPEARGFLLAPSRLSRVQKLEAVSESSKETASLPSATESYKKARLPGPRDPAEAYCDFFEGDEIPFKWI